MEYRRLPHGKHNEKFSVLGHCESRCPFAVKQESRMVEIAKYFNK